MADVRISDLTATSSPGSSWVFEVENPAIQNFKITFADLATAFGGSGDVVGPASATDNAIARFDLTTGKLIQNSTVLISDAGAITGVTDLTATGDLIADDLLPNSTSSGVSIKNKSGTTLAQFGPGSSSSINISMNGPTTFSSTLSASSGQENKILIAPTINQSGTATAAMLRINPTITTLGSGGIFGVQSQIASGTGRWNVYVDGTAQNYFAGNVGIGITTPSSLLHVEGAARFGTTAATTPQVTIFGGATGTSLLSLQRTSGATITYEFNLAGGGLGMRDVTAGDFITANYFGDTGGPAGGGNQLYLGQRGKTLAEATPRNSILSGTTFASLTDQAPGALRIVAGLGTGNTNPGPIEFWAHLAANGASGTTQQTAVRAATIARHSTNFPALWLGDSQATTDYCLLRGNAASGDTNTYLNGTGGVVFRINNTTVGRYSTAGLQMGITGAELPTHAFTVGNSLKATAFVVYNTADQITNTEIGVINWSSNIFQIFSNATGTGTARRIRVMAAGVNFVDVYPSFNPGIGFSIGTTNASGGSLLQTGAIYTNTSGTSGIFTLATTYNQVASTAANTDLLISRTETSVGSGAQRFIDCQVGGTSRFRISNLGEMVLSSAAVNGIRLFNTADEVTNTETLTAYWTSNLGVVGTNQTGTGSQRELTVGTFLNGSGRNRIRFFPGGSTTEIQTVSIASSVAGSVHLSVNPGSLTAASGTQTGLFCNLTANQSGTAGYTGLLVGVTETTTGSGVRNLLQAQVGGVNRFRVSSTGDTVISSLATNGLSLFNTADEATNTERLRILWNANVAHLITDTQGTGTMRELRLGTFNGFVAQNMIRVFGSAGTPFVRFSNANSNNTSFIGWDFVQGAISAASGTQTVLALNATVNQSGTAAYTMLDINTTETATGTGVKNLINARVGGTTMWAVNNFGIPLYNPSTTQSLNAGDAISVNRGMIKVQGNAAAVTLTSTPTIAAGTEGQVIFIVGQSNVNTVTVQDRGTLVGSNLRLGAATRVIGTGDVLALVYDGSLWAEMYYANNL